MTSEAPAGAWLFRYRSFLPVPLALILLLVRAGETDGGALIASGALVVTSGQVLRLWAVRHIGTISRTRTTRYGPLMTAGPYAVVRNPLYVGNFLILVGLALIANSVLFIAVGVPFFIVAYLAIIAAEENYLRQKFGDEFDDYCARVPRLFPILSGLKQTLQSMGFNWQRLIVKEYGSAFAWISGAILLLFKHHWLLHRELSASVFARTLLVLLLGLGFLYGLARYLKKAQILRAE